jgi:hypothetical protein
MFITTTLGGIALAMTVSTVAGTVAGVLMRPTLERVRDRVVEAIHGTADYVRRNAGSQHHFRNK